MKALLFSLSLLVGSLAQAATEQQISETLLREWTTLRQTVESLEPDGYVGGHYAEKFYDNMSLL